MQVHAFQIKNAKEWLGRLSTAQLEKRLADLEALGKAYAARLAKGERGELSTYAIQRGQQRPVYSVEYHLNGTRGAWQTTRIALALAKGEL